MVVVESALLGKGCRSWGGYWRKTRAPSWRDLRVIGRHLELIGPIRCCGIDQEKTSHHVKALLLKATSSSMQVWGKLRGMMRRESSQDAPLRRGCLIRTHLSIGCYQAPPCNSAPYRPQLSACLAIVGRIFVFIKSQVNNSVPRPPPRGFAWYLTIHPLSTHLFSSFRKPSPRPLNSSHTVTSASGSRCSPVDF